LTQKMDTYMRRLISILLFLLPVMAQGSSSEIDTKVSRFISDAVREHRLDRDWLQGIFDQLDIKPIVVSKVKSPAEKKPWFKYRSIFLTDRRVQGGVAFWQKHSDLIERASQQYGVRPEIIVAIIGVETSYGTRTGKYRVLDSVATLAFSDSSRSGFFRRELMHFFLLSHEEKIDPLKVKGSYAGAMGIGQFISSSYREYAVDFDQSGTRNLWEMPDAIGSVANYFKRHGWQADQPIVTRASLSSSEQSSLFIDGLKPKYQVKDFYAKGVSTQDKWNSELSALLLPLQQKKSKEYWLAANNFYVITRYNHSPHYAMAVYQLSQEIKKLKQGS